MLNNHSRARVLIVSRLPMALFGVLCVALGMTVSLFSFSFQISSPPSSSSYVPISPATVTVTTSITSTALPSDEYALAYRESFGLFDDIPEKSWKRMQQHARNYVQYYNSSNPSLNIDRTIKWYIENQEPNFSCPHVRRVGKNNGHGDGPKWTCNPHRINSATTSIPMETRQSDNNNDCLIYSIGSNGEYDFEEGLLQELGGGDASALQSMSSMSSKCEIHVFDFGGYQRPDDTARNIHYHQWGLEGVEEKSKIKRKMMSFPDIVKTLGHEKRTIDILKIDCEGCEWYVMYSVCM